MRIIAGEARGRIIDAPKGENTRPTLDRVRENLFNMLQPDVPGSRVLDLFAGSGALSLEAISRGAVQAVLVDHDREAVRVQRNNISRLGYEDRTLQMLCDWQKALCRLSQEQMLFDLVFLDPPYRMRDLRDLSELLIPVIHSGTLVVLEHEASTETAFSERFAKRRERAWGYCAVSFYQLQSEGEGGDTE